jgi:hypothetical protein
MNPVWEISYNQNLQFSLFFSWQRESGEIKLCKDVNSPEIYGKPDYIGGEIMWLI